MGSDLCDLRRRCRRFLDVRADRLLQFYLFYSRLASQSLQYRLCMRIADRAVFQKYPENP